MEIISMVGQAETVTLDGIVATTGMKISIKERTALKVRIFLTPKTFKAKLKSFFRIKPKLTYAVCVEETGNVSTYARDIGDSGAKRVSGGYEFVTITNPIGLYPTITSKFDSIQNVSSGAIAISLPFSFDDDYKIFMSVKPLET